MASASGLRHRHVNLPRSRRCALVPRLGAFEWDSGSLQRLSLQFRIVCTVHVSTCIATVRHGYPRRSGALGAALGIPSFFFLYLGQVLLFIQNKKG